MDKGMQPPGYNNKFLNFKFYESAIVLDSFDELE